jgi:transposase
MHSKRILRLERLRTASGEQLPRRLKEEIKRELRRLEPVLQMIKAIDTECDAIASAKASTRRR